MRLPPSAAAELAVRESDELERKLNECRRRALSASENRLANAVQRLRLVERNIELLNPQKLVLSRQAEIAAYSRRLLRVWKQFWLVAGCAFDGLGVGRMRCDL